jgi:hypothetical protein
LNLIEATQMAFCNVATTPRYQEIILLSHYAGDEIESLNKFRVLFWRNAMKIERYWKQLKISLALPACTHSTSAISGMENERVGFSVAEEESLFASEGVSS